MTDYVQPSEPRAGRAVERELTTPRAAGAAGLMFAVLFVASLAMLRSHPSAGSSTEEIASWYLERDAGRIALVGLYLAPFSGIAFLWFIAVIRNWIGEREDRFFATAFLGSGLVFVTMVFAASAAVGSLLAAIKFQGGPVPSADTVVLARSLAFAFLYVFAVRAAAVFMMVVSTIGLRTGIMPRWFVLAGYAIALVLLFSVTYFEWIVLLFPAWVAVMSVMILRAERAHPTPSSHG